MENRYDKYKDSGIAWIGEIPEHWKVKKLGHLYIPRNEKVSDQDYPALSVTMQGVLLQLENVAKTNDGDNRKLVKIGDFAINSRSDRRGSCGISKYDGSVSLINTVLIPINDMNPVFYEWLFHSSLFSDEYYRWGHGIVNDLWTTKWQEMKNIQIVAPPLQEQQSIAAYLDQKCGEIDELITLQEKMIIKLQSYKQSVITEAVTKGLDKNVPLKDSGIEWIGKIPEHWEVRRMKSIYNFGKGLSITKADLVDKGIPVISYGQIHSKLNIGTCIKDSLIRYVPKVFLENNNTSLVKKGDVIFADTSEDLEGCGNCIYIDRDMLLYAGYHTIIAKNISTSYNRYFSYLFQTDCWRFQIRRMVNGVKLFSIPQKLLASADLIVPSTQEQQSIADYLDQKCSEIDELISIKQQKIEKLKEYKKSLIFECVTGKRKVS